MFVLHSGLIKLSPLQDQGGWTPIMWAAEDKQFDATQLLIEQGANVHIRDLVQLTYNLVHIGFPPTVFLNPREHQTRCLQILGTFSNHDGNTNENVT